MSKLLTDGEFSDKLETQYSFILNFVESCNVQFYRAKGIQQKLRKEKIMSYNGMNKGTSGISIAALVCAIVSIFFNPLYLISLLAIIFGIIGLLTSWNRPKGCATAGLILGIIFLCIDFVFDLIMLPLTFGLSFFF